MAVSESRIKTEKLIESSEAGASGGVGSSGMTSPSGIMDLEPEGLTDLLPSGFSQFSNFKDLMNVLSQDVKSIYKQINDMLTPPSLSDLVNGLNSPLNRNANPVNSTLGIFHAVLCGDGKGIDFHLRDLINALAYDFGFLNWNICGRQQVRNPVDVMLNSVDNMRKDYNALVNLGPRTLKNLQKGVNSFIKNLGLPKSLEACMLDNALSNLKVQNLEGIPPGALDNLRKALSPDICKRSNDGVPGYSRTVEKTKVKPLVTGLVNYNEETMYAFQGSILASNQVSNDVVMEVLSDSIKAKDSDKLLKTLQLIAFTKITVVQDYGFLSTSSTGVDGVETYTAKSTSIATTTYNAHKVRNGKEVILDEIIQCNESDVTCSPLSVVSKARTVSQSDMKLALDVNANVVLTHMKDDLVSETKDPEHKFNQVVQLLKIADPKFRPEEASLNIGENESIRALAEEAGKRSTYKSTKQQQNQDYEIVDGIKYIKVYNDISLMDQVIGYVS